MNRGTRVVLAILVLLAAVVIAGRMLSIGPESGSGLGSGPGANALRLSDAACDSARRACVAEGDDFAIEWLLGPPVRALESFALELRVVRGSVPMDAQITVDFHMRAMDMGQTRYRLQRAADGVWHGRAMLPVCVSGRSDWVAAVSIQADGRRWTAELPFTVTRR